MANIHKSITEIVGHTPLVELTNYNRNNNLKATLIGKLEYLNPTGSVKDRAALNMIEKAEAEQEFLWQHLQQPKDIIYISLWNLDVHRNEFRS